MEVQIGQLFDRHEILDLGLVKVVRFSLPAEKRYDFESAFGNLLAAAYLLPLERLNPDALPQVPSETVPKVRRGDFGEALAKVVYNQLLSGYGAPGSKLWGKPNPDTSQTGEDRVALLTRSRSSKAEPVTVESKVRTTYNSPQALLGLFNQPAEDRTRTRKAAWLNTVRDLSCAGAKNRDFAYLMANLMHERSSGESAALSDYHLHGFLVVEPGSLSDDQIVERWSEDGSAPISRLVVIEIDDLATVVDACFEIARMTRARDLAPHIEDLQIDGVEGVSIGLSVSVSVDAEKPPLLACPVSQAALWFLSDRDGLGAAMSGALADNEDRCVGAFAKLLGGGLPDPSDCGMADLVAAVGAAWLEPAESVHDDMAAISKEAERWIDQHPDQAERARLVAAALINRLARHPRRLLQNEVVAGGHLDALLDRMIKKGLVALWPPQARTISAGLVTGPPGSFIVSLPTSGGKTLLIAMSTAKALDTSPDRQVVILANTRALVRHLRRSLRLWLPGTETVALLGEIAHVGDTCFPPGGLQQRIVVTTPERFDLDWRRAVTGDAGTVDPSSPTSLVIVDEAHQISELQRGARLEAGLARARRAEIPIQLFSSQLGGSDDLVKWLGNAPSLSSDWRPADVHRKIFFRQNGDKQGVIQTEEGEASICMEMPGGRIDYANPSLAVRSRVNPSAASGLALDRESEGLVLIYTPQKRSVSGLAAEVVRRVAAATPSWEPSAELAKIADRLPPAADQTKNYLRLGIGIHHASLTKFEHRAVEEAAERGLLRYVVCTDTLLSGIDFPVRTVIATNCRRGQDLLSAAHLNNLAGRAGRGGRFMTGELVLMATTESQGNKIRDKLARGVPPTKSQLGKAYHVLQRVQAAVTVSGEDSRSLQELDSFILAAIAEAALEQGDLRLELEEALSKTLWWAGAPESRRDQLVESCVRRAGAHMAAAPGWNRAVFRTGLDVATCTHVDTFVATMDPAPFIELANDEFAVAPQDLLEDVSVIATLIQVGGARWPDDLEGAAARRAVLTAWLSGATHVEGVAESSLARVFASFESSATWIVGSALEILGWRTGLTGDELARLAARLGLSRLRTGTPSEGAARLVDGGLPREDASELWYRHREESDVDFIEYARANLPTEVVALIEWPGAGEVGGRPFEFVDPR